MTPCLHFYDIFPIDIVDHDIYFFVLSYKNSIVMNDCNISMMLN